PGADERVARGDANVLGLRGAGDVRRGIYNGRRSVAVPVIAAGVAMIIIAAVARVIVVVAAAAIARMLVIAAGVAMIIVAAAISRVPVIGVVARHRFVPSMCLVRPSRCGPTVRYEPNLKLKLNEAGASAVFEDGQWIRGDGSCHLCKPQAA